jgi:hypothetical protein
MHGPMNVKLTLAVLGEICEEPRKKPHKQQKNQGPDSDL